MFDTACHDGLGDSGKEILSAATARLPLPAKGARVNKALMLCLFLALFASFAYGRLGRVAVSTCALDLSLTEDDKASLMAGGVVLRAAGSASKLSLIGGGSGASILLDELQDLRPTYLAEVIRKMPYQGNEDLCDKIIDILIGLSGSVDIPYISSKGKVCSLYSSAEIISDTMMASGGRYFEVDILMHPIDMMRTRITVQSFSPKGEREYIRFTAVNEEPLCYHNIKVVGAKKTLSTLLITNDGNEWTMYAVCGARAIRLPLLDRSIRISFLNRIKGFCDYVVKKLDGNG